MFEGAFKERCESVIALRDVEPSSFSLLLDFLYDRDVNITADNVEALLDLSARYAVSMLRRHCCAFLARSANPGNACSLLAVADRYDCHRLRRGLLTYILEVCTWRYQEVRAQEQAQCSTVREYCRFLGARMYSAVLLVELCFAFGKEGSSPFAFPRSQLITFC